ncbi:MAG: hypothetical protein NZ529_09725, partial [Cytophagaceae bacterium]|nr:hypothetical protein [Cytophagaceae bacterium]MDW8457065.1 hypothetical protein [Cytophagaceae bacterium]
YVTNKKSTMFVKKNNYTSYTLFGILPSNVLKKPLKGEAETVIALQRRSPSMVSTRLDQMGLPMRNLR